MSTLKVDAIVDSSNGNTATINSGTPVSTTSTQIAKAWVNFNGTGTVAINGSYNVTSVTDNGTGNYTVNFTNALADANYAVLVAGRRSAANPLNGKEAATPVDTTSATIFTSNEAQLAADHENVFVAIFR